MSRVHIHIHTRDADFSSYSTEQLKVIESQLWAAAIEAGSKSREFDYKRKELEKQAREVKKEITKRSK